MIVLLAALLAPPDSLTLADALARARATRPRTAEMRALTAEARGALRSAGTIPNPVVSYSHSGAVPREHLLVDQPLDWLLRRGPDRDAARAGVARAQADSAVLRAELGRDVRVAFFAALAAAEALRVAREQASLADSIAGIGAKRLAAGDISLLEREQVGQEAIRAAALVSQAREADRAAQAAFVRAIGWSGAAAPRPSGDLAAGLDTSPDTVVAAADSVPVVRGAAADSAASAALLQSARRGRIPMPSLQGGAEWNDPSVPGSTSVLGFAIPLPLWNQNGGAVAEAKARADRDAARAAETRLDLVQQVAQQRARLLESAVRARFARDSLVPTAQRVRARVVRGFAAGDTDVLPVLDALRAEREATLQLVQELFTYQQAVAEWYVVIGQDP